MVNRNWIVYGDVRAGTFKRAPSDGLPLDPYNPSNNTPHDYIVKIIENYNLDGQGGTNRGLYVLYGVDNSSGNLKEIWRTDNLNSSDLWVKISGARTAPLTGGPDYPIDMAISARGGKGYATDFLVSATTAGDPKVGSLWRYQAVQDHWVQTPVWSNDFSDLTGAVYFQNTGNSPTGGKEYVQSMVDVGNGGCGNNNGYAGLWWRTAGNDTSVWRRMFSENSSEQGWAACNQARGTFDDGIAKCLSKIYDVSGIPAGFKPYWGSRQFVSMFDSTAGHWKIATTDHDGGTDFNSTGLDNANAATICVEGALPAGKGSGNNVWAGFYDMGLWKNGSGAWHNQNGPSSNGTNGENDKLWGSVYSNENYGGNITGMVWTSSTTALVTEASSSKGSKLSDVNGVDYAGYNYRLWRSTSSGARNSWEQYGTGLPKNLGVSHGTTPNTGTRVFLTSLFRNADDGRLWLVAHMDSLGDGTWEDRLYVSGDDGANWIQEDTSLPSVGLFVVRAYGGGGNDTCVVGGYKGLYRRIGTTGAWSAVSKDSVIKDISGDIQGSTMNSNVKESIHNHRGIGIQDIYRDPVNSALWFVVVYAETDADKYGVFASDKHGVDHSWASFSPSGRRKMRRTVTRDSCGTVYVGSGRGFCSPNADFSAAGIERAVAPYGSGDWTTIGAYGSDFPEAHTFVRANNAGDFYLIAPGQGLQYYYTLCEDSGGGCDDGCETERPGNAAGRPREEAGQPKLPRTMFSVAEARELVAAGKLELFDVSGRRAQTFKPGVFFQIERNKAGVVTTRRTVLVTH